MCRSAKQIIPPIRMRMALAVVRSENVPGPLKLPIRPMLKNSSRAPKITPLIPASDNRRLVVNE